MSLARAPKTSTKPIFIATSNFYMRTATADDASERWAAWFDQPDVRQALNLPAKKMTTADIAAYVGTFDQQSDVLIGIFDKANDLLVGIGSAYIDWQRSDYIINTVIGEPAYRNAGVMTEITPPFRDYFFDVLDLKSSTATALATNRVIRAFLENTGWTLVQTQKNQIRRHSDGAMIDLCVYKLTCQAWQDWKAKNLPAKA